MQDASYYLKSLRHNFAKTARKGDGGVGVTGAALLTAALAAGGAWMIADETPDTLTTPQTETVLAAIQTDLTALQKDFTALGGIETRLKTGDYTTAEFDVLQNNRVAAEHAFRQKAEPVLDRILFTPHLSEEQAEDLMNSFKTTIKDPAEIGKRYDIADYGFLRDKRAEIIEKSRDAAVGTILDRTQKSIENRDKDKWLGFSFGMIPVLFVSLIIGAAVGDSRRIKNWAHEKPQKTFKPKH